MSHTNFKRGVENPLHTYIKPITRDVRPRDRGLGLEARNRGPGFDLEGPGLDLQGSMPRPWSLASIFVAWLLLTIVNFNKPSIVIA